MIKTFQKDNIKIKILVYIPLVMGKGKMNEKYYDFNPSIYMLRLRAYTKIILLYTIRIFA